MKYIDAEKLNLKREYFNGHSFENMFPKEKQKEQKPAEWSEDYREEDIQTRFAFYTYKDDPSVLYLSNVFVEEASRNHGFGTRILRAAEKVAEVIGATTISLKVKQDSPANAWYRKNGYGYVTFEDGYDWLEKNLEYLKPKQKEQKPVHTAKEMWKEMRLEVYAQASGNRHEPNYSDDSTKMFSLCDIDEIFEKIGDSTIGSLPAEWSELSGRCLSYHQK